MRLLYPDSLYDLDTISCSVFMYFQEDPFAETLHPTVSMFIGGCDPFKYREFVIKKNPVWKNTYLSLFNVWFNSEGRLHNTTTLLEPIKKLGLLKSIWLIYSKSEETLAQVKELILKVGVDYKTLFNAINIDHASQELMAHIHFEKFLEIYGSPSEKPSNSYAPRNVDFRSLYEYCDSFFKRNSAEELLVNAYFLRLVSLQYFDKIMLSNEKLIPFLNRLQNNWGSSKEISWSYKEQVDVVAWEIFRQLLSPYIDNFDSKKRISLTEEFIIERKGEIEKLKFKCWKLAEDFKGEKNLENLSSNISHHISVYAENDIQELLKIDNKSFIELRDKIFSDEKTWIGLTAFIISIFTGGEIMTAGSAIITLSNIMAKSYKTYHETKKSIDKSDYSLIYRIKNY